MTAGDEKPPVGSVADEAARLLRTLGAVVPPEGLGARYAPPTSGHADPSAEGATRRCTCGGAAAPECRICPVCLGIRVLRDLRPEVLIGLADLAGEIATSLRAVADDRAGRGTGARRGKEGPQP